MLYLFDIKIFINIFIHNPYPKLRLYGISPPDIRYILFLIGTPSRWKAFDAHQNESAERWNGSAGRWIKSNLFSE